MSEPERFVLTHDADLMAERVLNTLRRLVLTWLEGAVMLYHYSHGFTLADVAERTNVHVAEVAAARKSLVRKAAIALGYLEGEIETAELPLGREERRQKVLRLRDEGLSIREIADRLSVSVAAIHKDLRAMQETQRRQEHAKANGRA